MQTRNCAGRFRLFGNSLFACFSVWHVGKRRIEQNHDFQQAGGCWVQKSQHARAPEWKEIPVHSGHNPETSEILSHYNLYECFYSFFCSFQLSIFLNVFSRHSLDFDVVKQLFKQIIYIVVSSTVNNLLLRREMCHWFKGMQIRYNLSELEEWLRNHRLAECGTLDQLTVLVEIAQLLQVGKKSDADVDNIVTMCTNLSNQQVKFAQIVVETSFWSCLLVQIIKVLSLYTPINDYEDKVSVEFIRKTEEKLKLRSKEASGSTFSSGGSLLMDSKHLFPITFPYHPSQVALQNITIPETLSLDFLKRV